MPTNVDATALCRLLQLAEQREATLWIGPATPLAPWLCLVTGIDPVPATYHGDTPDAALAVAARHYAALRPTEDRQ